MAVYPLLHKLNPPPKPITKIVVRTKTKTKIVRKPGRPTKESIDAAMVKREASRRITSADAAILTWRVVSAEEPIESIAAEYGISLNYARKVINETKALNVIRFITVPECRAMGLDDSHQGGKADALDGLDIDTLHYNDPDPEKVTRRHLYDRQQMTSEEIRLSLVLIRLGKATAGEIQEKYKLSAATWRDYKAMYSPWGRVFREKDGTYTRTNDRADRMKKRRTASNPIPRVHRKLDPETQEIAEAELDALEKLAAVRRT
jgi:hypothetical protein